MNSTDEEWRFIPGYPDYEVSSLGRVRSWRKWNGGPAPRFLKPQRRGGYLCVGLATAPCVCDSRAIHQLIMEAFVGPRPLGQFGEVVRHLDGQAEHNVLSNLAYGSFAQNTQDTVRHGRFVNPMSLRTHCPSGHPYDAENTHVGRNGKRRCRTCMRRSTVLKNARVKAARAARGPQPRSPRKSPPRKTHCLRGHEYTEENTYYHPDPSGARFRNCRECRRIDGRKRRAERLATST